MVRLYARSTTLYSPYYLRRGLQLERQLAKQQARQQARRAVVVPAGVVAEAWEVLTWACMYRNRWRQPGGYH